MTLGEQRDGVLRAGRQGEPLADLLEDGTALRLGDDGVVEDGAELVAAGVGVRDAADFVGEGGEIALLDAVSGAALSTTTMGPAQAGCVISGISPDRTLAVVGCTWAAAPSSVVGEARVLDVGALAVRPALMTGLIPSTAVFRPDNRAVFLTSAHRLGFGTLNQHDVATGAVTLSSGIITPGRFTVAFAPLAPALGATVVGTRLDLSWTLPPHSPAATRYALEAGTAPGRTDIGTVTVGPGQTLSIPSVPPGAYLVRVRAANATGVGTASNEVSVTVP